MKTRLPFLGLLQIHLVLSLLAGSTPRMPAEQRILATSVDPIFEQIEFRKAPKTGSLLLKKNDRLAICGDSITEQKRYSRIIETYLTVCEPALNVSVRQYGWSGETAQGFLRRMTNDCLRFQPTVATTCYGMNDYKYRPYDEANAQWYRENYRAVVETFKTHDCRVVLGCAGCVGKVASWVKTASGTLEEHNLHLYALRNIAMDIAAEEKVRFADVYWPMLTGGDTARRRYGADYAIAGQDGVHPDWAGHLVMAYAYLKALGLKGDLGTITVNLKKQRAEAKDGHEIENFTDQTLTILSRRYPFCAPGAPDQDNSLRSGTTLVPFYQDLSRLRLVLKGASADRYRLTWGETSRVYPRSTLTEGINLADDFPLNPFSAAFQKVDEAVAAKQAFETKQIKHIFHGKEGREDMDAAVTQTEIERDRLVEAVHAAFVPVRHALKIESLE